ncbi:MFS transporter [Serratia entomophila]|uniref:MFS transporter n=1 Tax=Serratia entomophila TaxID=42906 RepID=UPI00217AABBD|nr:MFS transporter [Serratia entomophila]CAI0910651.1 High-copy suppressor of rspA [Serratia entomophila]CAI1548065.1 High-copy suppressor of rspA [Serratia entomophila]CAI1587015.1 High-copy suppressor of rspA [Serratia entomophila]CAI1597706.1 High-copy suppressor of rspA [Serratia entomophila]CAI1603894.1 High-copy suppressor of rspA [Serratia entomophila]
MSLNSSPRAIRGILASLSLSMLLSSLGISIANVGLPALAQAFNASFQAVQWVILSYLLAVTTAVIGAGYLGDRINRRRLLLGGIALFTFASLLCAVAPALWLLLAARVMQGMGAAVMMSITMALAGETLGAGKIGRAMGLLGTMSAVGTALGPSLGGALIFAAGWRAMFLINLPLGMAALLLAWRFLPDQRREAVAGSFDRAGTLLLGFCLLCYALAMTLGRGHFSALNLALLLAAALAGALFFGVERRAPYPLIRPAMLRHPALAAGLASSALVMTVMTTTLVVGPFYLSRGLGLSAVQLGLVMASGPAVAILTGVPAGYLVDRWGAPRITALGLTALTCGIGMLSMTLARQGMWGYIAPLCLLTTGYALFQVANNTTLMKDLFPQQRGAIAGMLNLARNLGGITGASAMGALFALACGNGDLAAADTAAVSAGMRVTYATAALLALAALGIALGGRALMARYSAAKSPR